MERLTTVARAGLLALVFPSLADMANAEPAGGPPNANHGPASREATATERFVAKVEGLYLRYERLHERGGSSDAESTMEIVAYGRGEAYVRMRTMWGNYHSCSLHAVFRAEAAALVYEGQAPDGQACRMRISLKDGKFMTSVRDLRTGESLQACTGSCGARGTFDGDDRFALRLRRPIRYMRRLLDSAEYAAALAHREGRIGERDIGSLDTLRRKEQDARTASPAVGVPGQPRQRERP